MMHLSTRLTCFACLLVGSALAGCSTESTDGEGSGGVKSTAGNHATAGKSGSGTAGAAGSAQPGTGGRSSAVGGSATAGSTSVDGMVSFGGNGTAGGEPSLGGESSAGGEALMGGETSQGGEASLGGEGSVGGETSVGGGSSLGGEGSVGGEGSAGASDGGEPGSASMFVSDYGTLLRFAIAPKGDPVQTAKISVSGGMIHLGPTGELFVGDYGNNAIDRFLSPLDALTPNGTISGVGLDHPNGLTFVDSELWVVNTFQSSPTITRLAFDAQGAATSAGTVTAGLSSNDRRLLWISATRDLYVSRCYPDNRVLHYRVALDHAVTSLSPISDQSLSNPHGLLITPWGELFVANLDSSTISRFSLDTQGNATPNGIINVPSGTAQFAFAPWGELFNLGAANVLSRFTFDTNHTASPSGTFTLPTSCSNACSIYILQGSTFASGG